MPWPVWLSMAGALMLVAMPLPDWAASWNPDWLSLVMIYWIIYLPARVGIGSAWFAGLLLDVMEGAVLGQHALALSIIGYLSLKFYLRIRVFPMSQQTFAVLLLLMVYHFVLFWVDGIIGGGVPGLERWYPWASSVLIWPLLQSAMRTLWPRMSRD
jgi:rod shape-determining protein MreD